MRIPRRRCVSVLWVCFYFCVCEGFLVAIWKQKAFHVYMGKNKAQKRERERVWYIINASLSEWEWYCGNQSCRKETRLVGRMRCRPLIRALWGIVVTVSFWATGLKAVRTEILSAEPCGTIRGHSVFALAELQYFG